MPIAHDFTSFHSMTRTIDFTQCLPNGSLKYTELCNVLQMAAGEHADSGGISFSDMQKSDQAWVLSRMRVEISELPKWKDEITISTWIISLENSRSVRAMEIHSGAKKLVGCETLWVVFNTKTRRPEPLILEHGHFEKYPERFAVKERVSKIDAVKNAEKTFDYNVVLSDIDIVNHVNNVKYLEWCLDDFPADDQLNGKIKSLEMNFLKELNLNDVVAIETESIGNKSFYTVKNNAKPCFTAEIELL
ncbi:MAG: acyl-[acyl-carrier-protein] thioesterase [Flavobacterium sp.]|uniref:acyl-[acyl-carrier-protein] thioesterase n=1 Tax=Flavobacterium sp. TaxID=239 RepID=UPI001229B05F|nr:acyl-ACP thioesterase domain-containing protein [Flavobacterium sp.]RZJ65496.1 MAG: acyl-[acyl-carrier-protein] thioesterase [Flavobacterium sp.]